MIHTATLSPSAVCNAPSHPITAAKLDTSFLLALIGQTIWHYAYKHT